MKNILVILASYLIGSVSFGYLAGRLVKGIDIRRYGSGNMGTTNIQRTLGTWPALVVLALDIGKGVLAIAIAKTASDSSILHILAGLAVVAGHNWSVLFRFTGGRGVATTLGVLCGLSPVVFLLDGIIILIIIAVTRYVSLASILGAIVLPVLMILFKLPPVYIIAGCLFAVMIIWQHRPNIERLIKGTENRLGMKVKIENEVKK